MSLRKKSTLGDYNIKIVLALTSPAMWVLIARSTQVLPEWGGVFHNFSKRTNVFFSNESLLQVLAMRHAEVDSSGYLFVVSKLFYNKLSVFISEFLSFLSFYSPRFFFQAGDGTVFSPNIVEPIVFLLFPFWVYGLFLNIKNKRWWLLAAYLSAGLFAFLFGKRELSFLWPVLLFQLYFIHTGIKTLLPHKITKVYLGVTLLYGIFLLGRIITL